MKYGVVFPQLEIATDDIRTYVTEVEKMGYDYLLAYDHVVGGHREDIGTGPYDYNDQFHEILTLFSYAAGITETLEFVSGILILPQRQTALVAKQAAQIDVLSGGRLRLGVAVGWNKIEMEALGEDFHTRGKRIEEQIEVMRLLWTQNEVTFEGEYHSLSRIGIRPFPVQQPIPIWFGGGSDVVLKRLARIGDGWMPNGMPMEQAREQVATVRGYLEANDRDPDTFGIDVRLNVTKGTTDEWQTYLADWRKLGATHMAANTMGGGYQSVDEHLKVLRQFIELVR